MHRAKHSHRGKSRQKSSETTAGVVCAHASEREALVLALNGAGGIRAIDCGDGLAEGITRVRDLGIHLVLLALEPGPAASFASALRSADPAIRSVVLVHLGSEGTLARLAAAGVVGFIPPSAGLASCVRTLRAVRTHGFACPPEIATAVLRGQSRRAPSIGWGPGTTGTGLHGRRLEVAECVAGGLSNKEIGARLGIAAGTVKNHVHAVLATLSVEHRWQVAGALRVHATHLELVPPGEREEIK